MNWHAGYNFLKNKYYVCMLLLCVFLYKNLKVSFEKPM